MPEVIRSGQRKARKQHQCDYCGAAIEKGEVYDYAFCKYDDVYTWKSHIECQYIVDELWEYIDPDDCGVTSDDFHNVVSEFCRQFVCPKCDKVNLYEYDNVECNDDESYCVHKVYALLKTHKLVRIKKDGHWTYGFELKERSNNNAE